MSYVTPNGVLIDRNLLMVPSPKRIIPIDEVKNSGHYADMADLAIIFQHHIIEDGIGTWRWKPNGFIHLLCDHAPVYTPSSAECFALGIMPYTRNNTRELRASLSLNALAMDLHAGLFSIEEWMKFYMQMGYSLSGYAEVFGQHEASEYNLPDAKVFPANEEQEEYGECVLDYVLRIYAGKTLML